MSALVVGSGPNGLAAAISLARAGVHVTVFEAAETWGGALRTEAVTLPGFLHDGGAAVFPLAIASPFFRSLHLDRYGLQWIEPDVPLAHPLADGDAVAQLHSLSATAKTFGIDGPAWLRMVQPLADAWPQMLHDALAPPLRIPKHPFAMAALARFALRSAQSVAGIFETERVRTLFAGLAAHANIPLDMAASAGEGVALAAAAHTTGWPIARGGAQRIADAMVANLHDLGGEVITGERISSLRELPPADAVLLDITPQQFVALAGDALSGAEQAFLASAVKAPGACKVDWALSAPIPWRADVCRRAGTVHLGASFDEIAASECDAWEGRASGRPYVLLSQPSVFDPSRAPEGRHVGWAYCHVPNGSPEDFSDRIEQQVERYAPGFRETIRARHTRTAPQLEQWNPNLLGGDVSGGAMTLKQIVLRTHHRTPLRGVYLCSSSTAPGGGVHGMCGWHAAAAAAKDMGLPRLRLP